MIQPAQPSSPVSPALTARSTHTSVGLSLAPSALISLPILPPRRSRYIENHLFAPIHPVFLLLRDSTEDWVFSLQLYLPAAGFSHRYLYSSPDFNYLANLFNFHREWESENSGSFITAHTGREFFSLLPSPMFAGKLCQIQTNSLIITCLFAYALLAVKYSGPFCGPLFHSPLG